MSCEGNGPKPKVIIKGQSIEEINNAVVDDGWIYKFTTELYHWSDDEWKCVGMRDVYIHKMDDPSRGYLWVDFNGEFMLAENIDEYGYSHLVWYGHQGFYF